MTIIRAHLLSRANAQRVFFGMLIRALLLTTLKLLYILDSAQRPNLTGYPFMN